MEKRSVIVKLGGSMTQSTGTLLALAREIASVRSGAAEAEPVAIVHGGGGDVSAYSRRLGLEPSFTDGIRMTSEAEMDVVDMVLCGLVNKRVVRAFASAGLAVVGISGADGNVMTGTRVKDTAGTPSRTARADRIDTRLIQRLWESGYVPVIASPATDASGNAVNINADEAAFSIGVALGSGAIAFFSDVPGVLVDNAPVKDLTLGEAERLIAAEVITGGMVAKIRSIGQAIEAGVERVAVGSYERPGDLHRLLHGEIGTTIHTAE
jgi:acetylglutamate kinase